MMRLFLLWTFLFPCFYLYSSCCGCCNCCRYCYFCWRCSCFLSSLLFCSCVSCLYVFSSWWRWIWCGFAGAAAVDAAVDAAAAAAAAVAAADAAVRR